MGPAAQRVLGHLAGPAHVLHPPVEVGDVRLQHLVPARCLGVEQHLDLVEAHARGLAPDHRRDPDHVVAAVPPPTSRIAGGGEQAHVLPVPQDVGLEAEPLRHLTDRPRRGLTSCQHEVTSSWLRQVRRRGAHHDTWRAARRAVRRGGDRRGPAGLQATLTLARVHRTVLMVDSGSYRNDPATHMHNVVTHDGTPPAEFRAAARKELAAYDTATVRDGRGHLGGRDARSDLGGGFVVALGDEVVRARGIVLATGVVDTLPDKPGLEELFGSVVAHCPFCHGHEFAGRHVGILGTTSRRPPARPGRADRLPDHCLHRRRGAHRRAAGDRRGPRRPGHRTSARARSAPPSPSRTARQRRSPACSSRRR